jgi:hypothetical protein
MKQIMLNVFQFSLNDVWDGIETNDKQSFKTEFLRRCETISEKEFKRWITSDYSFFSVYQLADTKRFHDLQQYIGSSISLSTRRQFTNNFVFNQTPADEIRALFNKFPNLIELYSDFLFQQHTKAKQEIDDLILYLKCSLPFIYRRWDKIKLYVYREDLDRRKQSRLLTFGVNTYKNNVKTETMDFQKNYAKIEKHITASPKVKRMVGVLYRDCGLILDLIRICGLYCSSIYVDPYGRPW